MNRNAFVVSFLTSLILALILFSAAGCITAKLFRLSSQSSESFETFVQDLNDYYNDKDTEDIGRNSLLIMDPQTLVAYFSQSSGDPKIEATLSSAGKTTAIIIKQPSIGCEAKVSNQQITANQQSPRGCICRFISADIKWHSGTGQKEVIPTEYICFPLAFELSYDENMGVGRPVNVDTYHVNGGFFADRKIFCSPDVKDKDCNEQRYENGRRINFLLQKSQNGLSLKEQ